MKRQVKLKNGEVVTIDFKGDMFEVVEEYPKLVVPVEFVSLREGWKVRLTDGTAHSVGLGELKLWLRTYAR